MASRLMFPCVSGSFRQNRRRRALNGSASLLALCFAAPPLLLATSPAPAQTVTTSGDVSPTNPTSASPWTTGDIVVGNTGAGSLAIEDGGVANTGVVRLGFNTNSTGTVTVSGSGSTLTTSDYIYVGWFRGQGTLAITNGATVTALGGVFIGDQHLDNTVTVSGRGTTLTTSEIDVGFLGSGKLTIADGAAVNAGTVIIGSVMSTATGTMTVSGNGSTLTSDSIFIGSFGSGTLTIADGAVVNATSSVTLTEDAASTGTLNIGAAAGSAATAPGTLNTPSVSFGDGNGVGTGTIVFNHTSSHYLFAPAISGSGAVNVLAGTTIFTADSTYTGATSIASGAILQLGNGGTTGSIVTDVTNNGTLIFNRSDTLAYGGVISGSGNLVQNGSGTLVLTGINAYSGGTLLNSGTLSVGNDSAIGTGTLAMAEGTTLDFAVTGMTLANAITVSGDPTINVSSGFTDTISGTIADGSSPGDIVKTGAGTLILTGNNTYTGGTTISAGTLQLGDGGTTGAIVGPIVDNAALVINRSNGLTLAGVISGTGTVAQVGTGTTTLAGVNTYSGGTTISAGTLVGSATSFGTGAIVDNAALVIDQASNGTFNNVLSGTGALTTTGGATLTFASDSSAFTGTTDVAAGTLSVIGSLAGSAVTVESGATLAGTGTVGATTLLAGSTISPGVGGVGMLSINGNYAQASGATYVVQVDPTTSASDRIAVTGAATIASGAVLDVVKAAGGSYSLGTKYTVLTTTGGVNGTYTVTGATDVSAFISLGALYDTHNVYLVTTQSRSLTDAAVTPNQIATAQGLQSAPITNTALTAVLNQQSDAAARYALDPLSGEIHASIKGQMLNDSRFARNAVLDRLRDTFCSVEAPTGANKKRVIGRTTQVSGGGCEINPDRITAWGSAFGAWGRTDGDGNAAALNRSIGGFVVGADARIVNTWRVGLMAGYDRSSFTARDRSSSGSSDDYHLGVYGGTQWGQLALRLGSAYTWHDIDTSRMVSFPGLADSLKGSYNAGTAQAFAELGYRIDVARVAFEPFVNLAYVNLRTDGFTESGGQAALTSRGASTDATFTTLGLHTASNVDLSGVPVTVKATLGWRHAFGETTPSSTFIFSDGGAFTVSGVPIATNAAVAETGLAVAIAANAVLGVSYGGQFSSSAVDQSVRGNLTVRF